MPPKRGRGGGRAAARASSRARATPGPADLDGTRDSSPSAVESMATSRARLTPGPSKFSTSYGSPAIESVQRTFTAGTAAGAIGSALHNVRAANEEDLVRSRAARGSRQSSVVAAAAAASSAADDEDSLAMPPPPPPARPRQQETLSTRAASAQPGPSGLGLSDRSRLGSEPLHSDAASLRSFVEESELYGGANVTTPRAKRLTVPASHPSANGGGSSHHPTTQKSPTRSSARLAARNSVGRHDSVPPTPGRAPANRSPAAQTPSAMSDSIDEDDEEDPLQRTPRGPQANTSPFASQTPGRPSFDPEHPNLRERIRAHALSTRGRSLPWDSESGESGDESDRSPPSPSPRGAASEPRQQRRNPVHDARLQGLALPRPDRPSPPALGFGNGGRNLADGGSRRPTLSPGRPGVQSGVPSPRFINNDRVLTHGGTRQGHDGAADSLDYSSNEEDQRTQEPQARTNNSPPFQGNVRGTTPANRTPPRNASYRSPTRGSRTPVDAAESRLDDDDDAGQRQGTPAHVPPVESKEQPPPRGNGVIDGDVWTSFRRASNWLVKALKNWGKLILLSVLFLVLLDALWPVSEWEGVPVVGNHRLEPLARLRRHISAIFNRPAAWTGNQSYDDFMGTLYRAEANTRYNAKRLDYVAGATFEMRRILPELIKIDVNSSTNSWSVGDEFWHALSEQMQQGSPMYSLLSLKKSEDGSYIISDSHWDAIKKRIQGQDLLPSNPLAPTENSHVREDEIFARLEQIMSEKWKEWRRHNEEAIKRVQGTDEDVRSAHWQDLYGNVEKAIATRLESLGLEEKIVTREEFVTKIEEQSLRQAAEIKTEMERLKGKLDQAIGIAHDAMATAQGPHGLSRSEVQEIIAEAERRSIADAQLEAMAKGHIKSRLNNNLSRQKNYFNPKVGAVIDPTLTTTTYRRGDQATQGYKSRLWNLLAWKKSRTFVEGGEDGGLEETPNSVLRRWEEDGECWCAALSDTKDIDRVADVSIFTAGTVIPQHMIVEHIDPRGTFDPDSAPKDIEVWMLVPRDKRQRKLSHWSKSRWPESQTGQGQQRMVELGFVKIGEFQYDHAAGHDEIQVFKLSEELLHLQASTRQVFVRAKTNYGAEDHTCFYRLRLLGEDGDTPDDKTSSS